MVVEGHIAGCIYSTLAFLKGQCLYREAQRKEKVLQEEEGACFRLTFSEVSAARLTSENLFSPLPPSHHSFAWNVSLLSLLFTRVCFVCVLCSSLTSVLSLFSYLSAPSSLLLSLVLFPTLLSATFTHIQPILPSVFLLYMSPVSQTDLGIMPSTPAPRAQPAKFHQVQRQHGHCQTLDICISKLVSETATEKDCHHATAPETHL